MPNHMVAWCHPFNFLKIILQIINWSYVIWYMVSSASVGEGKERGKGAYWSSGSTWATLPWPSLLGPGTWGPQAPPQAQALVVWVDIPLPGHTRTCAHAYTHTHTHTHTHKHTRTHTHTQGLVYFMTQSHHSMDSKTNTIACFVANSTPGLDQCYF